MAKDYEDARVLCPFYRRSSRKAHIIRCEGPFPQSGQTLDFYGRNSDGAWQRQLRRFCQKDYTLCPVYRQIMREKYREN